MTSILLATVVLLLARFDLYGLLASYEPGTSLG